MEDWAKGVGTVIVFAIMSAVAVKIGVAGNVGEVFVGLCVAGFVAFLAATAHRWGF